MFSSFYPTARKSFHEWSANQRGEDYWGNVLFCLTLPYIVSGTKHAPLEHLLRRDI